MCVKAAQTHQDLNGTVFALQLERKIVDDAASARQALQDQAGRLKHEADDRNRDQFNELVDVKEQLQVRGLRPAPGGRGLSASRGARPPSNGSLPGA